MALSTFLPPKCTQMKIGNLLFSTPTPMLQSTRINPGSMLCRNGSFSPVMATITEETNPMEEWIQEKKRSCNEGAVAGVFGHNEACLLCNEGLLSMKHRGREAAAVAVHDGSRTRSIPGTHEFSSLNDVLLPGNAAVGFVQHAKDKDICDALVSGPSLAFAFAGFLVGTSIVSLVTRFRQQSANEDPLSTRLLRMCEELTGAFAMILMFHGNIMAVRDPYGFRPLVMGKLATGGVCFASETKAIEAMKADYERDILPGEILAVGDDKGATSSTFISSKRPARPCVLDALLLNQKSASSVREACGRMLAGLAPVVIPSFIPKPRVLALPNSAPEALGFSRQSGMPVQMMGDFQLASVPWLRALADQVVVIVGANYTDSFKAVKIVQEYKPLSVHVRLIMPPIGDSCCYEKLKRSVPGGSTVEVQGELGVETFVCLSVESVKAVMAQDTCCHACME